MNKELRIPGGSNRANMLLEMIEARGSGDASCNQTTEQNHIAEPSSGID